MGIEELLLEMNKYLRISLLSLPNSIDMVSEDISFIDQNQRIPSDFEQAERLSILLSEVKKSPYCI